MKQLSIQKVFKDGTRDTPLLITNDDDFVFIVRSLLDISNVHHVEVYNHSLTEETRRKNLAHTTKLNKEQILGIKKNYENRIV